MAPQIKSPLDWQSINGVIYSHLSTTIRDRDPYSSLNLLMHTVSTHYFMHLITRQMIKIRRLTTAAFNLLHPLILTLTTLSTLLIIPTAQATTEKTSIKALFMPVLGASITRQKMDNFINDLETTINTRIALTYSNNRDKIFSACRQQAIDFFFVSQNKQAEHIVNQCGYKIIAKADSSVSLYVKTGTQLSDIEKVGVIKNYAAGDIGRDNMPGKKYVSYNNVASATVGILQNEVDAISAGTIFLLTLPEHLAEKFKIIKTFEGVGGPILLISSAFSQQPLAKSLQSYFLNNPPISVELFEELFGLTPWYLPASKNAFRPKAVK